MEGITTLIEQIVFFFVNMVDVIFNNVFIDNLGYFSSSYKFNIYLFSDKGWFEPSLTFYELIMLIMGIFIFIFVLRLLWKGTKKFINLVFGVFRV